MAGRPLNILILSTFDGSNANVIRDFLFSFHAFSRHRCFYVFDCRSLGAGFDFDRFDVIVVFWSVYLPNEDIAPDVMDRIAEAPAIKALFLQDEYREIHTINGYMARLGIQHMFSCVDPADQEIFYPRSRIPTLDAVHEVLTGYLPEGLRGLPHDVDRPRGIDVGYRARELPAYLGDLAHEKYLIADRFRRAAEAAGFRCDISAREQDRIYGRAWDRFLASCRFALGTPSGASVVDFTGEIRRDCERYRREHPEAGYAEIRQRFFADVDGRVVIETISPRVFEATAHGSVLIMQEGRYAGVIEPDRHFIPIARDYSNLDEVMEKMRDPTFCRALAEQAYDEIVASDRYTYRTFVKRFDGIMEEAVDPSRAPVAISRMRYTLQRYRSAGQRIVPCRQRFVRLPWVVIPVRREIAACRRRVRGAAGRGKRAFSWISGWRPTKLGRALVREERSLARLALPVTLTRPPSISRDGLPGDARVEGRFAKTWIGLRFCLTHRGLRRVLLRALHPMGAIPVAGLIRDGYRLEVLRRAQLGHLETTRPFRLSARSDDDGCLMLSSHDVKRFSAAPSEPGRQLLRNGWIREVIWDHSAIGEVARFELRRGRPVVMHVSPAGMRFEAMGAVLREHQDVAKDVLIEVLGAEHRLPAPSRDGGSGPAGARSASRR